MDRPTGQVADLEVEARYDDLDAIRAFARGVDVVTFEFENVSADAADAAVIVPVRQSGSALHVTQQRAREKAFLADCYPVTPFAKAQSLDELAVGLGTVGLPAIVKTAAFGYDGKGQHRINRIEDGERVWGLIGRKPSSSASWSSRTRSPWWRRAVSTASSRTSARWRTSIVITSWI